MADKVYIPNLVVNEISEDLIDEVANKVGGELSGNYVTLDTEQTITGDKAFANNIKVGNLTIEDNNGSGDAIIWNNKSINTYTTNGGYINTSTNGGGDISIDSSGNLTLNVSGTLNMNAKMISELKRLLGIQ